MKQTAVEWLREKLWKEFNFSFSDNILEQAKAMEKEQIIDAYWGGLNGAINDYSDNKIKFGGGAEQYYNETFKTK
jgi:HEPN domain-containing protein